MIARLYVQTSRQERIFLVRNYVNNVHCCVANYQRSAEGVVRTQKECVLGHIQYSTIQIIQIVSARLPRNLGLLTNKTSFLWHPEVQSSFLVFVYLNVFAPFGSF